MHAKRVPGRKQGALMRAPGQFREREKRLLDRLPLEKRLNTMTFIIIIPLTVLVIYLMATVVKFCNAYNQSIVLSLIHI